MNISANSYENVNIQDNSINQSIEKEKEKPQEKELTLEEQMEKSAVEVSISMNAQVLLLAMDAGDEIKNNTNAQKDILKFLAGKEVSDDFNLANTGYTGKPISELSPEEAAELVGEDGFFGIEETANRVANFAISIAGGNLDNLEKTREGVVQGFQDAEDMWGGELPAISYATQDRTLEIIDKKIAELKGARDTTQTE